MWIVHEKLAELHLFFFRRTFSWRVMPLVKVFGKKSLWARALRCCILFGLTYRSTDQLLGKIRQFWRVMPIFHLGILPNNIMQSRFGNKKQNKNKTFRLGFWHIGLGHSTDHPINFSVKSVNCNWVMTLPRPFYFLFLRPIFIYFFATKIQQQKTKQQKNNNKTRGPLATARSPEWNSHCIYIYIYIYPNLMQHFSNPVIATNERIVILSSSWF